MKKIIFILFGLFILSLCSCSSEDDNIVGNPDFEFATTSGEYKVKRGKTVDLQIELTNATNPSYVWKVNGKVVSTAPQYTFEGKEIGEYFVTLRIDADNGTKEKQVKVEVLEKLSPEIAMSSSAIAFSNVDFEIKAIANYTDETTRYTWILNGSEVGTDATFVFRKTIVDNYQLILKVTNEDGESIHITSITVLPEPKATAFFSDGRLITNFATPIRYSVPLGRHLVLAPIVSNASNKATYRWAVDGTPQTDANTSTFSFAPLSIGTYAVSVTMTDDEVESTATANVECVAAEGTHYRAASASSMAFGNRCFEYMPAPGQFIDFQIGSNAEQGRSAVQSKLGTSSDYIASLGAFGGYVIVGFDHSVDNVANQYDLYWKGNAFAGWSEPGIVWVMQDENGNGVPDDTWYELKGSEYGKEGTVQRYAVTYYKPSSAASSVMWTDNRGNVGSVDYLGQYHSQAYYYPMYIAENSYTLTGSLLRSTFTGGGGSLEMTGSYDWGYLDNIATDGSEQNSFMFKIDHAVQADGSPANLQYIDFVKVHTGMLGKGALLGEVSTEFNTPYDNHLRTK